MKKLFTAILVGTIGGVGLLAFANDVYASHYETEYFEHEQILVLPVDDIDWNQHREVIYIYYGDGIIIRTYEASPEELEMGKLLQRPHINPSMDRTRVIVPPIIIATTHSIRNITRTNTSWRWNPSAIWTRNNIGVNATSVSWYTSQTTTAGRTVTLGAGVTDSVVSASLGVAFTASHAITSGHTRTWQVPFGYDGRALVTFNRERADFTCVSRMYFPFANPVETTSACSALGNPTNIVAQLERRRF